ncbi:LacI family DNA-binding transcriptional regulator, partial [Mycolicibacterium fortuitum]
TQLPGAQRMISVVPQAGSGHKSSAISSAYRRKDQHPLRPVDARSRPGESSAILKFKRLARGAIVSIMHAKRAKVTTRDIAEQLDVSVSTVGRALAQDPRISKKTRARVEHKANELGYVGNRAARMMRGSPSNVVSLIVPDIRNSFYSTAAHALSQSMAEHGFQLVLSESGDDPEIEARHVRGIAEHHVAGAILVPTPAPLAQTIELMRQIPHAQFLRVHPELGTDTFELDDRATLSVATQHLRDLGHQQIAYIGAAPNFSTSRGRLDGYLDVVPYAYANNLVVHVPPSSPRDARCAISELLETPTPPSALVTSSVRITEGVLLELAHRGMRVPSDLSIVGYGDESGFSWWGAGLTTMRLPVHQVATACAQWLLRYLSDDDEGAAAFTPAVGTLLERGSTARYGGQR